MRPRAMRCTPRSMSPHCGRTWTRQDWRASPYTARRPIGAPTCCGPISGGDCAMRIVRYCPPRRVALLFVVCDGLSATAVQRHATVLLSPVIPELRRAGRTVAPIVVAEQGRVALGDDIGEAMAAEAVAVLIGERPGLSAADSLGVYLTWQPRRGRTDAERNCISNIRPEGLAPMAAAKKLLWLIACDATATPDRRRPEGRAARRAAKPCHRRRLTKRGWMPDAVRKIRLQTDLNRADQGSTVMQDSPNAGLSRFRCRGNRGADVPPGDGGSLVRNWLGSIRARSAPRRCRRSAFP